MENLLYLVAALVVSVVISLVIVVRNRKPTSIEAGIEAFNRELRALAPDKRPAGGPRPAPAERSGPTAAARSAPRDKRTGASSG